MKSLSKNKAITLDVIDKIICDDLKIGHGSAKDMAVAIKNIVKILRIHMDARWGSVPLTSNRNLSWVVSNNIQSAMTRICAQAPEVVSTFDQLNKKSKYDDVIKFEKSLKDLNLSVDKVSQSAIDNLYATLTLLRAHFSANKKRTEKSGDAYYCHYCYRELWTSGGHRLGSDTCHVHADKGRTKGEYHLKRYENIKRLFIKANWAEIGVKFIVYKFKECGIPPWLERKNDMEWVLFALKKMDICAPNKRNEVAAIIIHGSNIPFQYSITKDYFPEALSGNMIRYLAYSIALMRVPSEKVSQRLEQRWKSKSVLSIATEEEVSTQIIHRQVNKWGSEINALRSAGLNDDIIKVVFSLKVLPPINI